MFLFLLLLLLLAKLWRTKFVFKEFLKSKGRLTNRYAASVRIKQAFSLKSGRKSFNLKFVLSVYSI